MLPSSPCPGNYVLSPVPVIIHVFIITYYFLVHCNLTFNMSVPDL